MPELVPLERKKEALQNILKSALPKLTVSLPDNLREKAKKFAITCSAWQQPMFGGKPYKVCTRRG